MQTSDLTTAFRRFNSGFADLTLREMLNDPIVMDIIRSDDVTFHHVIGGLPMRRPQEHEAGSMKLFGGVPTMSGFTANCH